MWVGRKAIAAAWAAGDGDALVKAVIEGKALLLPGPLLVLRTLAELAVTPLLWQSAALSLVRIFSGFLGGAVLAVCWPPHAPPSPRPAAAEPPLWASSGHRRWPPSSSCFCCG